jgi:colicin import membrane protein
MAEKMAQAPEGWYADPANPAEEIFWTGEAWSSMRRPVVGAQTELLTAPAAPAQKPTPSTADPAGSTSRLPQWGMILAIVALATALIPGVSFFTWLFAIPAIVLGVIALVRRTQPRGKALFATIGGATGWLIAIVVSVVMIAGIDPDTSPMAQTDAGSPTSTPTADSTPTPEEIAAEAARAEQEAADATAKAEADAAQKVADEAAAAEAAAADAAEAAAAAAAEEAARGTVSQQNALRGAQNYLGYTAFSRTGLIEQLEFEGYSTADATWGVDRVSVDWNEQAAKSAKNYLSYTSFSHSGLVDQLIFEGFTPEQAEYGVAQTGL